MGADDVMGGGRIGIGLGWPHAARLAGAVTLDHADYHQGTEHALAWRLVAPAGQQLLDLREQGIGVSDPQQMAARLLEIARRREMSGQVPAVAWWRDAVI